jgi:SAM-dependent methyltransferase
MKTRKKEWFDDASFWRQLYPFMFPEKDMAEVGGQMAKALKLAKPRGKTALDLCCGAGRYSIALAKRGFSVTGVDKTKYLLDKGRQQAREARVPIKWVRADMRDFVRPGAFSFVLSMYSSFGYFENKNEDIVVLEKIFASLQPGGVLLMDLRNKEPLAKIPETTTSHRLPDGSRLIERREIFDDCVRVRNQWRLKIKGKAHSYKFAATVYSAPQVRDMLKRAGFADVKLYGNLDGEKYGPSTPRLIAVAHKPKAKRSN